MEVVELWKRSQRVARVLACTALAAAAATACLERATPRASQPPALEPQQALWSEHLHSHTAGVISSRSAIRVQFVADVVPETRVGRRAPDRLRFEPALSGMTTWVSPRELVFTPYSPLPPGEHFRARLSSRGLASTPESLTEYAFAFSTQTQGIDVDIEPLRSGEDGLALSGRVQTADVAAPQAVEQLLSAEVPGGPRELDWEHSDDGRAHRFTLRGIQRGARSRTLRVRWDGEPIGAPEAGEQQIQVAARGALALQRVVSELDDGQPIVRVEFSDPIEPDQDWSARVKLEGAALEGVRVDGSSLILVPASTRTRELTVALEPGIQGRGGQTLEERSRHTVALATAEPGVRFVGSGTVLPNSDGLTVPFEAANVSSVQLTAFEVYEENLGQYLQTNALEGQSGLRRVGRYLWRRTLPLSRTGEPGQWNRYEIDVAPLFEERPGSLLRLTLSIRRGNAVLRCPAADAEQPPVPEEPLRSAEDLYEKRTSGWDYITEYYWNATRRASWTERQNPCKDAFYVYSRNVRAARNFLASNLGLIAKRAETGALDLTVTDLRTAQPLEDVQLDVFGFQHQPLGGARSDERGFARVDVSGVPFYLTARSGEERGVLKLSRGTALPTSHFDVGGVRAPRGIKGALYGERGVWRPGDDVHLTLAIRDREGTLPADHPATMHVFDPRGQRVETLHAKPVGRFYRFDWSTSEEALTGQWKVVAELGGLSFEKRLRIETVVPNRLEVDLESSTDALHREEPLRAEIHSRWLHGGAAAELRTDVSLELKPRPTHFAQAPGFVFDDPARAFEAERELVFEGTLDAEGQARFEAPAPRAPEAAGMLTAVLETRVHERGGGFSSAQRELPFHPFAAYVGIRLPQDDRGQSRLRRDTAHSVEIASLSPAGERVSLPEVEVSVYQLDWRWWWDRSAESLARYASQSHRSRIRNEVVRTEEGRGTFELELPSNAWGRYLLRACDVGGHCSGSVFYTTGSPSAGGTERGPGASVLTLQTDKPRYRVGEVARVRLPPFDAGRALLSVENGSGLLERRWVEAADAAREIELNITREMAPNAYVAASLIQPHGQSANDHPIRLYGYAPIAVEDPETRLEPVLEAADAWSPREPASLRVREAGGRPMTYTLAVVDQGLLGLTGFRTPDLHSEFHRREALGVQTWDLFDEVAGAYSGALERLLALGGDGFLRPIRSDRKPRRFPPVVVFQGPFQLAAGEEREHEIALPPYVGEVRAMLVAGSESAYGSTERAIPVRDPLMLLPSLPRMLRPGETLDVPVSVFVGEPGIREVEVSMQSDLAAGSGSERADLHFEQPGDALAYLPLRVADALGMKSLRFSARGGGLESEHDVNLEVLAPNPRTQRTVQRELAPGEVWEPRLEPYGLPGTARAQLEVSSVAGLELGSRLDFLIRYPHGCLEQTTSAAFPQLLLPTLMDLGPESLEQVRDHVQAALGKLSRFQLPDGSFSYWPGASGRHDWADVYAGHFLLEASLRGYPIPPKLLSRWLDAAESAAAARSTSPSSRLVRAYRLYALARAGRADVASMNRLRDALQDAAYDPAPIWLLASAYHHAGLRDVARSLAATGATTPLRLEVDGDAYVFATPLRNRALRMEPLLTLGHRAEADDLARRIATDLSKGRHSTQTTAWALLALAQYHGADGTRESAFQVELSRGGATRRIDSARVFQRSSLGPIASEGEPLRVRNLSPRPLSVALVVDAIPAPGEERAQSSGGLALGVRYTNAAGEAIDPSRLRQARDLTARITLHNGGDRPRRHLALTYNAPSGWQIQDSPGELPPDAPEPRHPWWAPDPEALEYRDVRDDAVHFYFALEPGEKASFSIALNASFAGRYYLPATRAEDMYDPKAQAVVPGRWIRVEREALPAGPGPEPGDVPAPRARPRETAQR